MYLPNQFNHNAQDEAGLEVHQFWPLVEIHCSPHMRFFLCSMYKLICQPGYQSSYGPATRWVCQHAKAAGSVCAPVGLRLAQAHELRRPAVLGRNVEVLCMDQPQRGHYCAPKAHPPNPPGPGIRG